MESPDNVQLRGFERLIIPLLLSLPIALGVGIYFLVAYWGTPLAWRAFFSSLIAKPLYYTVMGALGSFLIKEAGPVKAYIVLGIVMITIDILYKMPITILFDIAFIASMIMVLTTAAEESK